MIDQMAYNYQSGTNKLTHIGDFVADNAFTYDIDNQSANNYTYNAIGNLTQDVKGGLSSIVWNPYGKIAHISKGSNGNLYYDYDAMGNRIKNSFTQSNDNADKTWYVRDASGNIMAIYSRKNYGTNQQLVLENYELYGSNRLGSLNLGMAVEGDYNLTPTTNYTRSLGLKQYEISNHLGNVLTTFSDQRVFAPAGMSSTNSNALIAKLISAHDYYPFGMIMDGRSWNEDKTKYSFNGQEKDREIYNNESITTALFWEYDGRIGRRWNLDPKPQIDFSDYTVFENNPILNIDHDGDNPWAILAIRIITKIKLWQADNKKKLNETANNVHAMKPIKAQSKGKDIIRFSATVPVVKRVNGGLHVAVNEDKGLTQTAEASFDAGKVGSASASVTVYKDPNSINQVKTEVDVEINTPVVTNNKKDDDIEIDTKYVGINFSAWGRSLSNLYKSVVNYCKAKYDRITKPQNYVQKD